MRTPRKIAEHMLKTYSSPRVAEEMALHHEQDHVDTPNEWTAVRKEIQRIRKETGL